MRVVRGGLARAVAVLGIGLLATACTVVTGGKAQAPPSVEPRPLTGEAITQVLVDDTTLSRILNQPFVIDSRLPPRFGGPEALQGVRSSSPADCLGVAEMLHQSVYGASKVNDVAVEAWRHAARPAQLTSIKEGVVSLATAADAHALFSRFAQQWQSCDGHTVYCRTMCSDSRRRSRTSKSRRPFSREPLRSRSIRDIRIRRRFRRGGPSVYGAIAWSRSRSTSSMRRPVAGRFERYQRDGFRHRAPHDGKGQRAELSARSTRYMGALAGWNIPEPSASSSARITCTTALINARWVNACGKLPRCRPVRGSISSA